MINKILVKYSTARDISIIVKFVRPMLVIRQNIVDNVIAVLMISIIIVDGWITVLELQTTLTFLG